MQQSFSQLECLFPREFDFGEWLYGGAQGLEAEASGASGASVASPSASEVPAEGQSSGGRLRTAGSFGEAEASGVAVGRLRASGASGSNCGRLRADAEALSGRSCCGRLRADVPFADCVVEYLNALSQALLRDPASRAFPDVVTFAFFCRKANVLKLKEQYASDAPSSDSLCSGSLSSGKLRLGRGLVFHIAPSNVPINFAYSLVAGLLAGNYNVVRVSSKQFPQVDLVVKHIAALAADCRNECGPCGCRNEVGRGVVTESSNEVGRGAAAAGFSADSGRDVVTESSNEAGLGAADGISEVSRRIAIVRYGHESNANEIFSAACDVRVIWGGDATIAALRQCPIPPRSFDICFADRYSLAALNADRLVADFQTGSSADGKSTCLPAAGAESVGTVGEPSSLAPAAGTQPGGLSAELERLAEKFYNDTYLFDQNACSAPHLVAWTGSSANVAKAKELFWGAVHRYARKHYANFQEVMAVDKLTALYRQAVDMDLRDEPYETNVLRRVELKELPVNIDDYRCAGGYFTEFTCGDGGLDALVPIVKNKYQTLAYYGFERPELMDFVLRNRLIGIDRVVPLGETTAFSLTWDGYDLIDRMTRIVSVE